MLDKFQNYFFCTILRILFRKDYSLVYNAVQALLRKGYSSLFSI